MLDVTLDVLVRAQKNGRFDEDMVLPSYVFL